MYWASTIMLCSQPQYNSILFYSIQHRLDKDKVMRITSNVAVKMKENNIIGPYSFFKVLNECLVI